MANCIANEYLIGIFQNEIGEDKLPVVKAIADLIGCYVDTYKGTVIELDTGNNTNLNYLGDIINSTIQQVLDDMNMGDITDFINGELLEDYTDKTIETVLKEKVLDKDNSVCFSNTQVSIYGTNLVTYVEQLIVYGGDVPSKYEEVTLKTKED